MLDEIIGNTSDLNIEEHTTDTHGQTLLTFALFDLVGLRLTPRIAKSTRHRLFRTGRTDEYGDWPSAQRLLRHKANTTVIDQHWDDLMRIGLSIRSGHVTASLLTQRLQAGARTHPLAKALIEYGKILRTQHLLRWFTDPALRRRIGRQLNRGESLNNLRRYIFFAQQAKIQHRMLEDHTTQTHCHTLVTNACVLWTTQYDQRVIDQHDASNTSIPMARISYCSRCAARGSNHYHRYSIRPRCKNPCH